jgi:protein-S-isoprenylcysteine O-methyltransferase Ste14
MTFDPFGWASGRIRPSLLHRAIRGAAAALFALFLARRIGEYGDYLLKPLWAVETLVYAVLLWAFVTRIDPIDRSTGWRDVAVPLVGGVLPFALLATPPHAAIAAHPVLLQAVFWCMTAGTALTVWGMWTLRRAFSITVEARELVTAGPYRWIRHPIYFGEMATAAAVAAWRFSWANLVVLLLFVAVQLFRARREERKLLRWFPAYAAARGRWFWRVPSRTA